MQALFWSCFAALSWCYVGYPLTMVARARLRPRPVEPDPSAEPHVSVVLAVRNEERQLTRRVENLLAQRYPADRLEVVVVTNGCSDHTETVARELARHRPRVRALCSPAEEGKAGALNLGVANARGDVIVFADARQRFDPDAVSRLVAPFGDPAVGAVTGRLMIRRSDRPAVEGTRLYWGMETSLRLAESRTGSVVGATGAIYAVRRDAFQPIPANTILDDVLVPMRIARQKLRVIMAPDAVAFDEPAESSAAEYARKRRTMVGNFQLLRIDPALLLPGANPLWGRFVSHKLLRLLSPLCFLGMLGSAALLSAPLYRVAFAGELAIYLAGFAGLVFPIGIFSVPAAFVMMHGAIFSAFWRARQSAADVWASSPGETASCTSVESFAPVSR